MTAQRTHNTRHLFITVFQCIYVVCFLVVFLSEKYRVELNFCGFQFLRFLRLFHDPSKKTFVLNKIPAKILSENNLLHSRNYMQTSPFTLYYLLKPSHSFTNKTFRNKTTKLQWVHYKYLAIKSFKERDRLKVLRLVK